MLPFYKILFAMTLIFGTLISISAYSWLSMWMGLEINLLSIIPLLKDKNDIYPSESALKYFITQTMASSLLLFAIIISLNLFESMMLNSNALNFLMSTSLFIKVGAAPFHTWFPEVMEGLNWINNLILLTWQKIAPLILTFYLCNLVNFIFWIIMCSLIISGVMGLNQISLRKIMAYSSINHIGWMLASMLSSQTIWLFYFFIYSIISLNIIFIFLKTNSFYLNQLFNSLSSFKMLSFFFILNFMSLGGLPPFLGFFPKWLVINNLVINHYYILSILLIIFTLLTLFYYLRMTFSSIMIYTNELLIFKILKWNFWIIFFNVMSLSGLVICSLSFNFI